MLLEPEMRHGACEAGLTDQGDEAGSDRPDGCHGREGTSDDQAEHQAQNTLCQGCADANGEEEDNRENQSAHTISIG